MLYQPAVKPETTETEEDSQDTQPLTGLWAVTLTALAVVMTGVAGVMTTAQGGLVLMQSSINIDPSPIFNSISNNLPWIMEIFALPIGIQVGIVIVGFFGAMLISAFRNFRSM